MRTVLKYLIFRILFIVFLSFCCLTDAKPATSKGNCGDNIEWTLTDGTLTFYGSGQLQGFVKAKRPWRTKKIKTVIIEEGITNIGNRAFENYSKLTEISVPSSVKTIGDSAFLNCVDLKKIVIPNSVTAIGKWCFSGCKRLYAMSLSDRLQYIGEKAFYKCNSLTDIIIPNSVSMLGSNSFQECDKLTILIVPDDPFDAYPDTTLGLASCHNLSIVRGHHTLCPDYMLKYLSKDCPFMQESNPRRYYTGSISKDSVIIVPALKIYSLQETIDTIENIFNRYFFVTNPCVSYSATERQISRFIVNLEPPVYRELLQHYYDKFYEAGSNNELDVATALAFKYVMLGGKDDEELMWDIILTKYGIENETNNMRFLMNKFNDISVMRDSVYQHTVDSLKNVYYDVLYPSSLREMCGYWISVNDTTPEGFLTDSPEYIINIADITCSNGTTILSAPKCNWSSKKKKDRWLNKTYDNLQLRYSYETGYNQDTRTLRLLFSNQSKKIANSKLQHQALDITQNFEAAMSASLENFQKEIDRGLAKKMISYNTWGQYTSIGYGIDVGVRLVVATVVFAILYASNIETAQKYEILLTPQTPGILDASVRYAYARHNYNNGKTKQTENIKSLTFVKWEENDSIIFISNRGTPVFIGKELPTDNPLLEEYNTRGRRQGYNEINKNSMVKLRKKAEEMLLLKERKEKSNSKQSDLKETEEDLYF